MSWIGCDVVVSNNVLRLWSCYYHRPEITAAIIENKPEIPKYPQK